ncbi:MAG: hypothetical protein ABI129_07475 [Rhodanobacter sp.]
MSAVMQACVEMEMSKPGGAVLKNEMTPTAAVKALLDAGQVQDALKLLARLLPKRYAVAWLCQCARDQALDPEDKAGASLAERWVREPNESNRRAAFEFADGGGYKSTGAWIAAAAGWSGGSMAPASVETQVPPPDHLTACAVVAAINMLAALDIDAFEARRAGFISSAVNLLNGNSAGNA